MIIPINEEFQFSQDSGGYWGLQRKTVAKTGKTAGEERWNYVGHYATLAQACRGATRHIEPEVERITLKEYAEHLTALTNELYEKVKEVK